MRALMNFLKPTTLLWSVMSVDTLMRVKARNAQGAELASGIRNKNLVPSVRLKGIKTWVYSIVTVHYGNRPGGKPVMYC